MILEGQQWQMFLFKSKRIKKTYLFILDIKIGIHLFEQFDKEFDFEYDDRNENSS